MEDCIFCKLIAQDIPNYKIYEDEYTYAFLDLACDYIGHTLVVPKCHCNNLSDASNDTASKVIIAVQNIGNHYINNCGYDGYNVIFNNGSSANQQVMHMHAHIIPRKCDDGIHIYNVAGKMPIDLAEIHRAHKIN